MDFSVNPGSSQATLLADLTRRFTAYDGSFLRLYQNSLVPDPDTAIADFDAAEANFTGYAGVELALNPIGPDAEGGYVATSNNAFFQATDAVSPNTIGGAYIRTAGGALLEYYPFPNPVAMTDALAFISAGLILREPQPDVLDVEI